ncbi:hypothetical protein VTJ83DRAFT_98 [Remersonia thermophila]|uniref:Rhodopsin domain-containing protein n=1 Tax=Remersonia thermophila TaxID=72144 RepID=A0ABR4DK89_9PEZI
MASPPRGDPAAAPPPGAASPPSAIPEQYANPKETTHYDMSMLPHDDAGPTLNACRFSRRRGLWWDDAFLVGSWLCLLACTVLLTRMTMLGYGKHIWDFDVANNMAPLLVIIKIAGTLSVTAAAWSKTSFGITLLQLTQGWVKHVTLFTIVSMNIALGLSALFPWISCRPLNMAWDMYVEGTCWKPETMVYYNMFSGVYSACADLALALLPWQIIMTLQMRWKEKLGVGIAMSMGIFACVTCAIKVAQIPKMLSDDFADGVDLWFWGNAEISVTIIAASIPMLRVLVRDVRSATRRTYAAGYDPSHNATELTAGKRNTRIITITSGGGTKKGGSSEDSDAELGYHKSAIGMIEDDDHSDQGILRDDNGHCDALKIGRIVQTSKFQIKYDTKEVPSGKSA